MNIQDRIKEVATEQNAKAYEATDEKFIFCIDILGISAHNHMADVWVNDLEDIFDKMNE